MIIRAARLSGGSGGGPRPFGVRARQEIAPPPVISASGGREPGIKDPSGATADQGAERARILEPEGVPSQALLDGLPDEHGPAERSPRRRNSEGTPYQCHPLTPGRGEDRAAAGDFGIGRPGTRNRGSLRGYRRSIT